MPLLRSPWSTPSSSASETSTSSTRSSLSARSSSSNRRTSTGAVNVRNISGPMAKRVHVVEAGTGRPVSQSASLMLAGNGRGEKVGGERSTSSSRRTSAGQGKQLGEAETDKGPTHRQLVQGVRPRVVVSKPDDEGEGRFVTPPRAFFKAQQGISGTPARQKRFSLFTMDNVRELEQAEEGALTLWMDKLAVSPHGSSDTLPSNEEHQSRTPPLSSSSSADSSPASFRMIATPPASQRPFTPSTSNEGAPDSVTPKPNRLRLSRGPTRGSGKSASTSPPSFSNRLFHPSRWGKHSSPAPSIPDIAEGEDEDDLFGCPPEPTFPTDANIAPGLGRSLNPPTGLGISLSDPSLVLPSSSSETTPRASVAVRFASSSTPPSFPLHRRTPSELDRIEWEFVPPTVPSFDQGQKHAPPLEPRGTVRRVLQPHPKVRGRKSWRTTREPPVPSPRSRSRTSSAGRSARSGAATPASGGTEELPPPPLPVGLVAAGDEEDLDTCCRPSKGKGREKEGSP
ncbi:hypothetical protein JCM11641_000295 [Rhodosporidiobolus odoratus]